MPSPLPGLRATTTGALLDVRVAPRASRAGVGGLHDGRLVVRVTAAPVEGAANDAVIRALAEALDVPRSSLRIAAGARSKNKTIEIRGVAIGEIRQRLTRLIP